MFAQQLRNLRRKNNMTQTQLAEKLKVSSGTIAMWETEKRQPDLDTIKNIAEFFDVSIDSLLGKNIDNNITSTSLDRKTVRIPVYGTIPAGVPIDMVEDSFIEDWEEIPADWLKGGKKFACLKVRGESMMPEFRDGDTLILQKVDDCESGSYCAVSINHTECTFKKVIKKMSGLTLMPLNPAFDPIFFTNKEVDELPVTIIGIVKEVRRSY